MLFFPVALQNLQTNQSEAPFIEALNTSPCKIRTNRLDSVGSIAPARLLEETKLWFDQLEEAEHSLRSAVPAEDVVSSDVAPTQDLDTIWTGFLDEVDEQSLVVPPDSASSLTTAYEDLSLDRLSHFPPPPTASDLLPPQAVMRSETLPRRFSSLPSARPYLPHRPQPLNLNSSLPPSSRDRFIEKAPNSAPLPSSATFFTHFNFDRRTSLSSFQCPTQRQNDPPCSTRTSRSCSTATDVTLLTPRFSVNDGFFTPLYSPQELDFGDWGKCTEVEAIIAEEEEVEYGFAM